jgi:hypothetical protein
MLPVLSARIRAAVAVGCAAWTTCTCLPRDSNRSDASADAGKGGSRAALGPVGRPLGSGAARTEADRAALGRASVGREPRREAAEDPTLSQPWSDDFERTTLGEDWYADSPVWTVAGGQLCAQGAKNHPVWLKRRLPVNARIEFDATSASPLGDIKVEAWGDGSSGATGVSYRNATSYIFILGGWKNRFHVLARLDEHAPDRLQLVVDPAGTDPRTRPVIPNTRYHFKIERADGRTVRWLVDDIEMMSFPDPKPLVGEAHDHFAFNDWDVPVCFDRLVVTPLGSSAERGTR